MSIMVIDDSQVTLRFFSDLLNDEGFHELVLAQSFEQAFGDFLSMSAFHDRPVPDLILMDIHMPGIDGLQACRRLKCHELLQDVPIIIISGAEHLESLQGAFDAGAVDFVRKPPNRIELLSRVRAALRLKQETDSRKSREQELIALTQQLEEANRELRRISSLDGLTGIANRHAFNEFMEKEWKRAVRYGHVLSIILCDIDCFKAYNDSYGHLEGDECLRRVARSLAQCIRRSDDLVARYGGEEFIAILSETDLPGAIAVAEAMRHAIQTMALPHKESGVASVVTASFGVAACIPPIGVHEDFCIEKADKALYLAKEQGRNRVVSHTNAQ